MNEISAFGKDEGLFYSRQIVQDEKYVHKIRHLESTDLYCFVFALKASGFQNQVNGIEMHLVSS